jgi:hypothetical protein
LLQQSHQRGKWLPTVIFAHRKTPVTAITLDEPTSAPELVFAEPKATGTWLGEQRTAVPHVHAIQPV